MAQCNGWGAAGGPRVRRQNSVASQLAAAFALLAVASAQGEDPRPLLDRRLTAQGALVGQLRTAGQLARTAPGLDDQTRSEIERLVDEGTTSIKAGRDGEAAQSFYRALALGLQRPWSARDDYARSLVLRPRATVADPEAPVIVELGQIYDAGYRTEGLLTARAKLRRDSDPPTLWAAAFEGIASDLTYRPWAFAIPAGELEEGSYTLAVEVGDGGGALRTVKAPLHLVRGLEQVRADFERRLSAFNPPENARASVLHPFDHAARINLGNVRPRGFDFQRAISDSEALLESVERDKDPLTGVTGDLLRHYDFTEAGVILPYRLIVPESYDGSRELPLIIALHGGGGNENSLMMRPSGLMTSLARRHGYIVASPNGYRSDAGFGTITDALPFAGPARVFASTLSERDVFNVLERVVAEYRIDQDRIYVMGHSGGGGAAYRFASVYPDRWAAVAAIATLNTLEVHELEPMRDVPVHVSHGDADPVAPVETARMMVERMRSVGIECEYREIAGGTHDLVDAGLPEVFEFFNIIGARAGRARR